MIRPIASADGADDSSTPEDGSTATTGTPATTQEFTSTVLLRPLAPVYVPEQHSMYVDHLDRAVTDPKIRNVALTGRYGSGKSSVLDEFESRHERETLRISINTLGPDDGDEDLTNRIQKELVKQLVYRAKPGQVRRSRFARSMPLTWPRALAQSAMITSVGLILVWLLGLWPKLSGLPGTPDVVHRIVLPAVFVVLIGTVVLAARWLIGNRIVSQFATAGTTVTLNDKPDTYFDKFLDEIMAFFDAVHPKFVIFEDLDRFDDPRIFDSLRELNTLVNSSSGRAQAGFRIASLFRRGWRGMLRAVNVVTLKKIAIPRFTAAITRDEPKDEPVRFIFAIKDSLFEKLGVNLNKSDPPAGDDGAKPAPTERAETTDVAARAVERANRTKFFELVIPVVPFISHRNARDLLMEAFEDLGLSADLVSRPLLDLVARHTTDMRLMINICNEFAVFAEHLLWVRNRAPGMTADDLFALVAYKNFHLADFEDIAQRTSSLDTLEQHHRTLVRTSIEQLQAKKRALRTTNDLQQSQDKTAKSLGERLIAYKDSLPTNGYGYQTLVVSNETHALSVAGEAAFWRQVADAGAITITGPYAASVTVGRDTLEALFPESVDAVRWRVPSSSDWDLDRIRIDRDIAFLRGADFDDLTRRKDFQEKGRTFDQLVTTTLQSELARDLVRKGFINRNFAEYSAKFYGSFIGVDVAFFYNHSVQPNVMYVDYQFKSPDSVKNLLEQVPDGFTSTVSSLNIEVVSYLLFNDKPAARRVAAFIASDFNSDTATFLDAFLNEASTPRSELVGLLAGYPWPDVFHHLAASGQVPDETRIELFDAALLSARSPADYILNQDTRAFLAQSHPRLSAFTRDQPNERTKTVFSFARDAELTIADLSTLGTPLRKLVIAHNMYELTTHNLRIALGIEDPPTVERVKLNKRVWEYCRDNVDQYLTAIRDDEHAEFAVTTHEALSQVITEQHTVWTDEQLRTLVNMSAPDAALPDLTTVPRTSWSMVLDTNRVLPTIANVWAYVEQNGMDTSMARFLTPQGTPTELTSDTDTDVETTTKLAIRILNSAALPTTARVSLATGLGLPGPIPAADLTPTKDDLLARALEAKLLPDTLETFEHFIATGWEPVSEAFAVSANVEDFLTPHLVAGVVADLINDSLVPDSIRAKVVSNLAQYVTDDEDQPALRAAGEYARKNKIKLDIEQVQRIARTTKKPDLVVGQLASDRQITPEKIIDTLVLLGPPYSGLGDGADHEFDLPAGPSNKTIFERLEKAGRVELVKNGVRGGRRVRTLA